ncbi:MAG: hypothetical protein AAGF72_15470 [Pseudomonadota bacterium]
MNGWLLAAASVSGLTCLVHVFAGGSSAARPLLRSELDDEAKYTNYYCWHMVSIVIAAMACGFAYAAINASARDVAIVMTGLALAFTLWSLGLIAWQRQPFLRLPQWVLFAPIGLLGVLGVLQ